MSGLFANTLRPAIMAAGRREGLRRAAEGLSVTRRVVHRFVPGETIDSALDSVAALRQSGRYVSIDYLGEDVSDTDGADAAVRTYLDLIEKLGGSGHFTGIRPLEVSVKLSGLQLRPGELCGLPPTPPEKFTAPTTPGRFSAAAAIVVIPPTDCPSSRMRSLRTQGWCSAHSKVASTVRRACSAVRVKSGLPKHCAPCQCAPESSTSAPPVSP